MSVGVVIGNECFGAAFKIIVSGTSESGEGIQTAIKRQIPQMNSWRGSTWGGPESAVHRFVVFVARTFSEFNKRWYCRENPGYPASRRQGRAEHKL